MPPSSPSVDSRSNPTLDCMTDALLLREGHGLGDAGYVRGSSSWVTATATSAGAPAKLGSSTSLSAAPPVEPGERDAHPATAPAPAIVVRPGPATARARSAMQLRALDAQLRDLRIERQRTAESAAARRRASWWIPPGAFAVGAAAAAFSGVAGARVGLEVAIFACLFAGFLTLGIAITRIRRQRRCAREHAMCRASPGKPRAQPDP